MKRFLVIIALLSIVGISYAQINVKASIDSTHILIGGRTSYSIVVDVPRGTKVSFPKQIVPKEHAQDLEVLKVNRSVTDSSNHQLNKRTYVLTAWNAKHYTIPAQKVVINGKTSLTKAVSFDVRSIPVDTVKNTPMPPDDIQQVSLTFAEWLPVILIGLLILILLGLAYYLYKSLSRRKVSKKERVLSSYEQALNELEEIRSQIKSYSDQKTYYTHVTDVLRRYISKRYNFNALEMTSSEILDKLHDECKETDLKELEEIFNTVDLVKFAKYQTGENDKNYYFDNVVRFIETTKKDDIVPIVDKTEETRSQRTRKIIKLAIILLLVCSVALFIYFVSEIIGLLV